MLLIDFYTLHSGFTHSIRAHMSSNLLCAVVPGIWIPLAQKKAIWIDIRYEHLFTLIVVAKLLMKCNTASFLWVRGLNLVLNMQNMGNGCMQT